MSEAQERYWREAVSSAADECGAPLTEAQIASMAADIATAHENFSMAFGYDVAASNLSSAQRRAETRLRAELLREREADRCERCHGRGRIIMQGPYHSSNSQCWQCKGSGKSYHGSVADYERRIAR